ncbi:MAG: hypothetical protein ISS28_04905 [Candidatus Cloacimonetes bacterium]|nr:hypothetical protein [Candidatus Cloacimonadota bacterium]
MNIYSFIFWIQLVILSFIGVNIIVNEWIPLFNYDEKVNNLAYFGVCYSMIVIPLVMLFISKLFGFDPVVEIEDYYNKPVKRIVTNEDSFIFFPVLFLSIIGVLVIVYSYYIVNYPPLFALLQGESSYKLSQLRIKVSREFEGIVQIKNILGVTLVPFLSYIAYSYLNVKQMNKDRWIIIFAMLFISSITINLFTLAKIPVTVYLFSLLFLFVSINGRISIKSLIKLFSILIFLVFVAYIFIGGYSFDESLIGLDSGPIARVMFAQIWGLFEHFEIFPNKIDFLQGASLPSYIAKFLGKEHITSARAVMEYFNPSGVEAGIVGVMNTHFIAEAWANWGFLGLFLSPIWVAAVIQIVFITLFRSPKNPINLALMTYFTVYLGMSITGGFVAYIYNVIVIFILMLGILLKWFSFKSTILVKNN